jgi:hypothetical protein
MELGDNLVAHFWRHPSQASHVQGQALYLLFTQMLEEFGGRFRAKCDQQHRSLLPI